MKNSMLGKQRVGTVNIHKNMYLLVSQTVIHGIKGPSVVEIDSRYNQRGKEKWDDR